MATETTELEKVVQELADRAEIIDLESRKGRYADEKRFDDLADVHTEDFVVLMRDGTMRLEGLKAVVEQGRKNLSEFDRIQHVITNVLVDFNGDTAKIRANVIATHVRDAADPSSVWIVKGYYTDEAVRTAKGWRLAQGHLHFVSEEGQRPQSLR
jgi:hypothetical protein